MHVSIAYESYLFLNSSLTLAPAGASRLGEGL